MLTENVKKKVDFRLCLHVFFYCNCWKNIVGHMPILIITSHINKIEIGKHDFFHKMPNVFIFLCYKNPSVLNTNIPFISDRL